MSSNTSFEIIRFKNHSGALSWRLSGWLAGVRVRRNFKTREEAAAEKQSLEIRAIQVAAGFRVATTTLTDTQLRNAEDVFRRLNGRPHSIFFYLDYALKNYREPSQEKPLSEAITEYVAFKVKELERTLISGVQVRSIKSELKYLQVHFPTGPVSQLTTAKLTTYLERGNPGLKTYNNRRALVSTFVKYSYQQDWLVTDPIEKTPHHRIKHRRGSAVTLNADQAREFMAVVERYENGTLVPYMALCLFAGIRPSLRDGEIAKLQPEHIRLDTAAILIEPEVSKVRMKRQITIQPNLAAWLQTYPFTLIDPNYIEYHRSKIVKRFPLSHDVMRHTFISMFVAKYRSIGEAALQAGNSESIIRKHYLDLKSPAEAEKFFGISPRHCALTLSMETKEPASTLSSVA